MKILISVKTKIIFVLIILMIAIGIIVGCSTRLSIAEEEIKDLKIEVAHLEEETEEQSEQLSDYDILTGNPGHRTKTQGRAGKCVAEAQICEPAKTHYQNHRRSGSCERSSGADQWR